MIAQTPMHSIRPSLGNLMAKHAMDTLAMDFTLLEKPSDAFENVLVLTDIFTKLTLLIPTTTKKRPLLPNNQSIPGFNKLTLRNVCIVIKVETVKVG